MRILNFLCGIAVLFATLAYAHLLHHHAMHTHGPHHTGFMLAVFAAIVLGILSFIGGCLLLRQSR